MVKLYLAIYTFISSVFYYYVITYVLSAYEQQKVAFPILAGVVVLLAFLISFFRDKIYEIDVIKRIKAKDLEVDFLKKESKDKDVIIHSIKSNFANRVLNSKNKTPEEFKGIMEQLAVVIISDPIINNIEQVPETGMSEYMKILAMNHSNKSSD